MVEEEVRAAARVLLAAELSTRALYIAAVVSDALKKHGDKADVRMHAERTARHLWDSRKTRG